MPDEIRVVAHITARPESIDAVRAVLESFVAPTRGEEGCLRYELHQNTADPCDFTFIEAWTSTEALAAHLQTPHIVGGIGKLDGLLAREPDIREYALLA